MCFSGPSILRDIASACRCREFLLLFFAIGWAAFGRSTLVLAAEPPPPVYRPSPDDKDKLEGMGLQMESDGSYLYVDPKRRFTAHFRPDGSVQFADRYRRPDPRNLQRGTCCSGKIFERLNPLLGMPFGGPAEWVLRAAGIDPLARDKNRILRESFELRVQLAVEWNKKEIDRSLSRLHGELLEAWRNKENPTEGRLLLFQLWDDCDERVTLPIVEGVPGVARSEIDRYREDAAERARRQIESFIRSHAPAKKKSLGYSPAELKELNAKRRSRSAFEPYKTRP